jgi:hypothetical protein
MLEHLPINCPKCDLRMRYVERHDSARPQLKTDHPPRPHLHVCECPEHGVFHFSQTKHLTQGPPPTQSG